VVNQVLAQLKGVSFETKPSKCTKLCSKNGVTVKVQDKTLGNMNASTLYQVLNTWKHHESQEPELRPVA
jgi:NADH:ubiquinone oxidoreductase subunit E